MAQVYLGLGSNLGNRRENIKRVIKLLSQEGIKINKASRIIETEPVGIKNQPKFLNVVVKVSTDFSPRKLLTKIKKIEKNMGRIRAVRFGPRLIDLDILLYDKLILKSKKLTIPHPRMRQRDFVLKPLQTLVSRSHFYRLRKQFLKREL